ncbi:MAG: excinuclease ABC subunit UvrB [Candidatus Eisenbacteria bacterium]|nr:excinuclease ABC subunit UvrB [Candidatus Eisenbacteria bacterium]
MPFVLKAEYEPRGDQPAAIRELTEGMIRGERHQTLLGVTGSGKTFTIANLVARIDRPTLVISHNKTLAAQLYGEFRSYFPESAVEYFVSYYDYYQPEAYIPQTDTYIEKDASINDDIDRLRLRATASLLERRDTLIVASVSCIYGLGSPEDFAALLLYLKRGEEVGRDRMLRRLVEIQYRRNDAVLERAAFRVRGDTVEIWPAYEETALRVSLFGDEIESIREIDPMKGSTIRELPYVPVYPARHFVTTADKIERAVAGIEEELEARLAELTREGKLLEAQRLGMRTRFDMEMLRETGICAGIENYSRHLSGRAPGERPVCLLDYFPEDFLLVIDESHVTIPQVRAMYNGDRSRKERLVEHGFRLPSAMDNRPLRFEEFEAMMPRTVFVSATPAEYELRLSGGAPVEQLIRPTGLVDPEIDVRPVEGQVDDLLEETRRVAEAGERALVTTLTKRMAEDLTEYLTKAGVRVRYLHSDIAALERVEIIRELRTGAFDVLVGVNLLREGLDLPEVRLVAILDADREGFLRSETSLIQTAGRAARNVSGKVILYAAQKTRSIEAAVTETARRRELQRQYNEEHGITPRSIRKSVDEVMLATSVADSRRSTRKEEPEPLRIRPGLSREELLAALEAEMLEAAAGLEFERAASLRDRIFEIRSGSV